MPEKNDDEPQQDRVIARRLAAGQKAAVDVFSGYYANRLDAAFSNMCKTVNESCIERYRKRSKEFGEPERDELRRFVPKCGAKIETLLPHVANRAGTGCLLKPARAASAKAQRNDRTDRSETKATTPAMKLRCLECHTSNLKLDDLFAVAACLQNDEAALEHLYHVRDKRLKPSLVKKCKPEVTATTVEDIVDDAVQRLLEPIESEKGNDQPEEAASAVEEESSAGVSDLPPPTNRLASYRGECPLWVWLLGISKRAIIDYFRGSKKVKSLSEKLQGPDGEEETKIDVPEPRPIPGPAPLTPQGKPVDWRPHDAEIQAAIDCEMQRLAMEDARLHEIACLSFHCGFEQVTIATVTVGEWPSTISPKIQEIRGRLLQSAESACRKISRELGDEFGYVQDRLNARLERYFRLFQRVADETRRFSDLQPDDRHVAYLRWRMGRPLKNIEIQMNFKERQVRAHLLEAEEWRERMVVAIAKVQSAEFGQPEELHRIEIRKCFDKWFGNACDEQSDQA